MVNAKEEAKRRIDEWKAPDYCKNQRQQKCFFLGLLTGLDNASPGQMTVLEYQELSNLIMKHRKKRTAKPKKDIIIGIPEARSVEKPDLTPTKVKFLKDIPAYKDPDDKQLGPFKTGDVAELPAAEARWLINGKIAELIDNTPVNPETSG